MPDCKTCRTNYHYCPNCGTDGNRELGFCSDICTDTWEFSNTDEAKVLNRLSEADRIAVCNLIVDTDEEILYQLAKMILASFDAWGNRAD